jgi:phosphatidylserine decarboxylase
MSSGVWGSFRGLPPKNRKNLNQIKDAIAGRVEVLGFVEVGALSVGRIVQVHPVGAPFKRGEEKSVFRFGGSAIVVFGEPDRWSPSDNLLRRTKEGIETLVRLGEPVGLDLRLAADHRVAGIISRQ